MNIDISSDRKLNIASDLIAGHSWKKIISDNNICKTTFYNLKKHDEEFKRFTLIY